MMYKFQKDFKNASTISLIKKETGSYAATQPCEFFADEMTELVVNSINTKTLLPYEFVFKIQQAKEPFVISRLIDAIWKGDVHQVEIFRKNKNFIQRLCSKCFSD